MAYVFHGFFASPAQDLIETVAERWPQAVAKPIAEPFFGIGVRFPDVLEVDVEQDQHQLLREQLPALSQAFPDATFVCIYASCFGGMCEHEGFVCQAGAVLLTVELDPNREEEQDQEGVLQLLLGHLGVQLDGRGYFAPFTRGYFEQP